MKAGYKSSSGYNDFSLLATIEATWDLAPLTSNDRDASDMSEFFAGQPSRSAPLALPVFLLIVASFAGALSVVATAFFLRTRKKRR